MYQYFELFGSKQYLIIFYNKTIKNECHVVFLTRYNNTKKGMTELVILTT